MSTPEPFYSCLFNSVRVLEKTGPHLRNMAVAQLNLVGLESPKVGDIHNHFSRLAQHSFEYGVKTAFDFLLAMSPEEIEHYTGVKLKTAALDNDH